MANQDQNTPAPAEKELAQAAPKAAGASASRVDRSSGFSASRVSADENAAGKTTIADGVVAKVAGIAAREVPGVYALGGGGARAFGAIRDVINATGTWRRPFWPHAPGAETFRGRQLHVHDYVGAEEFAGRRVVIVGADDAAGLRARVDRVKSEFEVTVVSTAVDHAQAVA